MRLVALALLVPGVAAADTITTTTTTVTTVTISDDEPPLQPPSEVPPQPSAIATTRGLMVSAAVGPGRGIDLKDKCNDFECVAIHADIGIGLTPRFSLWLGTTMLASPEEKLHHHVEALALRYAPRPWLWAELGAGVGTKRSWIYDEPSYMDLGGLAPGGTAAVGYVPFAWGHAALEVQARFATTIDVEHTSFVQLVVGMTVY